METASWLSLLGLYLLLKYKVVQTINGHMFLLRDSVYINELGDVRGAVPHQFAHYLYVAASGKQHTGKRIPQAVNPVFRHPTGTADIREGVV